MRFLNHKTRVVLIHARFIERLLSLTEKYMSILKLKVGGVTKVACF